MFLEFVGLPGSGKTTLARHLEKLDGVRFRIIDVCYRTFADLATSRPLQTTRASLRMLPLGLSSLSRRGVDMGRMTHLASLPPLLNELLAYRDAARMGGVGVFDEFVHQRVLSSFGYASSPPSSAALRRALRPLRSFHTIPIFVEIDPQLALRRASARESGLPPRMAGLAVEERTLAYRCHAHTLRRLEALSVHSIRIDGRLPPEETAREIVGELDRLCEDRP